MPMNSKLILALAIVIIAVVLLAGLIASTGQQSAESELKKNNPIFHTLPEGGACRDGKGDCQAGLTCVNERCAKS